MVDGVCWEWMSVLLTEQCHQEWSGSLVPQISVAA